MVPGLCSSAVTQAPMIVAPHSWSRSKTMDRSDIQCEVDRASLDAERNWTPLDVHRGGSDSVERQASPCVLAGQLGLKTVASTRTRGKRVATAETPLPAVNYGFQPSLYTLLPARPAAAARTPCVVLDPCRPTPPRLSHRLLLCRPCLLHRYPEPTVPRASPPAASASPATNNLRTPPPQSDLCYGVGGRGAQVLRSSRNSHPCRWAREQQQ